MKLTLLFILLLPIFAVSQSLEELSVLPKPNPKYQKIAGWCAKEGTAGSDREMNLAKNRIDPAPDGTYHDVTFEALKNKHDADRLAEVERKKLVPPNFGKDDKKNLITKYEGIPIVLEGYLLFRKKKGGVKEDGGETCNCGKKVFEQVDYHLWLVKSREDAKQSDSVVIEMTPRVRAIHGNRWMNESNLQKDLNFLASTHVKLRVYGWLFFDGEHSEQLPKDGRKEENVHRATLWEIHPVMKIEKWENNAWKEW